MNRETALRTIADLLHEGSDYVIEITVRPEPVPDRTEFNVEWRYLEYDHSEGTWTPFQDQTAGGKRTGILQRMKQWVNLRQHVDLWPQGGTAVQERINAFRVNRVYVFSYYFAQDEIFTPLRRYYNDDAYRFEIPEEAFHDVQDFLENYFYRLEMVDDPARFCVVQRRDIDHPDVLYTASVMQQTYGMYHVFLMQDQRAVQQAVSQGATRLTDTAMEITL